MLGKVTKFDGYTLNYVKVEKVGNKRGHFVPPPPLPPALFRLNKYIKRARLAQARLHSRTQNGRLWSLSESWEKQQGFVTYSEAFNYQLLILFSGL